MKKILLLFMCVVMVGSALVGCGKEKPSAENVDSYKIIINDKEITLPCTLADMEKAGVYLARKSAKQEVVNNVNSQFSQIEMKASNFEDDEILKVMIETGDNVRNKEKNCVITRITNESVGSDKVVVAKNIGFESTIEDVKKALGKDCEIIKEGNDEKKGLTQLRYVKDNLGRVLYFQDDKCVYIEVWGYPQTETKDIVE